MSGTSPVICLEFNELTPWLMDRFISEGKLPHFQRLHAQSLVATTDAEADGEWLNPWVQWVTVHSGLAAKEHGVFRLSNGVQMTSPAVWDLASSAGQKVWVCGSMNSWYQTPLNGYLLPDAWSNQVSPYPQGEFEAFYSFIQKNVQEYAASKVPVTKNDIARFLKFLAGHGLRMSTAIRVARQLVRERLGNHRWRRATLLDAIQYDIFEWYYRKHRPQFSTLFFNSTAHYQHKFWRNMQPEAFQIAPTDQEQRDYKDAILYGYQQMDRVVGRILKLDPKATIVLLSGLGQQPYTKMEATGGKLVFRLHNKSVLTDKLLLNKPGLSGTYRYDPIMADEFFLRFDSTEQATIAAKALEAFQLSNGKEAFTASVQGTDVIGQCRCREIPGKEAVITDTTDGRTIPFSEVFYRVDTVKSGFHHPDGLFWVRRPGQGHQVLSNRVSLTAVAPTVLDLLGVAKPESMKADSIFTNSASGQTSKTSDFVKV
ncbi:MAG TPA: hypothetical protein VNQ76_12920 [Planctomicrobium sp.]|nr:hypothetical protein [Planctomicrobium sp.]